MDSRKRFDGLVERVEGEAITFKLLVDVAASSKVKTVKRSNAKSKTDLIHAGRTDGDVVEEKRITVMLDDIDRARLIPDV